VKIQISDLHFDVEKIQRDVSLSPDADVLVVAGDVCEGLPEAFRWLRETYGPSIPIVTVAGNHSFYRRSLLEELNAAQESAAEHNVLFLENSSCVIGEVMFIGATLWTDYRLFGDASRVHALLEARAKMNDHKKISLQKNPWKRFLPQDAATQHMKSVSFLKSCFDPSVKRRVVVTHHAPSASSLPPMYRHALISAAYASNLDEHFEAIAADLWIHGHIHSGSDYRLAETRVVSNPHGYGLENNSFKPRMIFEI
jgi:Icc-related predicted phosphoesterase